MMTKIPFAQLINSKKPKYKDLVNLLSPINREDIEQVRIFIDLDVVLAHYFNPLKSDPREFDEVFEDNQQPIIGDIATFCTYFRHFFASRMSKYTEFFFYFSSKVEEDSIALCPSYKETVYRKRGVRDSVNVKSDGMLDFDESYRRSFILNRNLITMVDKLMKFFPSAYLLDSKGRNPECIPYQIIKNVSPDMKTANLIVSDSPTVYQYLNLPDTYPFLLKGEKSKLITFDNYKGLFTKSDKGAASIKDDVSLLYEIFSLSGSSRFNVPAVQLRRKDKLIRLTPFKAAQELSRRTIDEIVNDLPDSEKERLKKNESILRIDRYFDEISRISLIDQIQDMVDHKGLEKFLSRKCSMYGVTVNWLYEGEEY